MNCINKLIVITMLFSLFSCSEDKKTEKEDFVFQTEQFDDVKILRYQVPNFENLTIKQKEFIYYLYEAALSGKDILFDQNYKYNLFVKRSIENIINTYNGDINSAEYKEFIIYAKKIWFSNGIHHHYSNDKFQPEFSETFFSSLIDNSDKSKFPLIDNQSFDEYKEFIAKIIFDKSIAPKKVCQDNGVDIVKNSAVNFYENVSQKEVEDYYNKLIDNNDLTPISYGLNSKLVKENGKIVEKIWKVGGMYSNAIEKIVYWLEKATTVAENDQQKQSLLKLVEYYKTGDLKKFDEYSILWLQDTASLVDVVNGFIEVYADPMGKRGTFESMVSLRDIDASKRAKTISENAKWFEENLPIDNVYKKEEVKGVTAKVINVVVESGDASPATPIGVNLPNADWIRKDYGSKSVTIGNIVYAYDQASKSSGSLEEFMYNKEDIEMAKKWGSIASNIHTDLHEIIGHGSGQLKKGVADPSQTLKNYASPLEETRAELVGLYFLADKKMIDLKLLESPEVAKVAYNNYITNGLLKQLVRIKPDNTIQQAHMRARQLIAKWAYELGKAENVIEKKTKEGKTYFVINDYEKLRTVFGKQLKEIQRIKSEGDFNAGKNLIENYAVNVDKEIHKEVLERWSKLKIAPYAGFINPELQPVIKDGKIIDIEISYPKDFKTQMINYSKHYSLLPVIN
ncbi:MAG: dihydrofolate reductase [Bacteroidetes bacterium GWE2_29_8]|nr:MAG: dihydrofolate reductase [Bacteroidetes bacterium GWE2_29_8]OFY20649.1 MAG: dihydrofolate reductase [Bacteroidetes bacterium GWF2_29_10]